ncbi:MAG: PH domain-containing protein [Acutalibacteraceae bacterium]|nr:PH domain-containing protein [Acutalibacteraceae bacterium]
MADTEIMRERARWPFLGLPFTFTQYVITDKKLIIKTGLFVSKESEILHYRILDMSYSRNLFQKMFKLGTITLYSQDVTNPELVIKNIKNSREFKDKLSELTESEKRRLSVRRGEVVGAMPHDPHCAECGIDGEVHGFEHPLDD